MIKEHKKAAKSPTRIGDFRYHMLPVNDTKYGAMEVVEMLKIDPKVDFAFKWLFGQERNLPLLVDLLNAILQLPTGSEIVSLELLNPSSLKDSADDKLSIVDVKARDLSGRQFAIEMQILPHPDFNKRILFYWSMLHQQQLYKGDEYGKIRPSVSISILVFSLFPALPQCYCLLFELWNKEYNIQFSSDIKVITIELPKFMAAKKDKIEIPLEGWLYFLCRGAELDIEHLPPTPNSQMIGKAIEELTMLSHEDLERERYLARERVLRDEKSRLLYAREDGLEQGRKEGREEGIEEGKARTLQGILKRRFPNLNASIENKFRAVDPELLDDLINLILEFSDASELELWLDKKQKMHD